MMHSCVRTMPTSNLLRRIFPLFQSSRGVCARLCYFFLKHLTKFIDEIIWVRSSFFFFFFFWQLKSWSELETGDG